VSTRNTREKGKQEVKQGKSGLIPCPFISCLKPIPKLALVLAGDPYICILSTSDGVIATTMGKIAMSCAWLGRA
jgi:hypothetical protein